MNASLSCLQLPERRVDIVALEQLLMRALFDNLSMLHDKDVLGISDCGQTMRDDHCCAAHSDVLKRFLDGNLCLIIDSGGRLIKNENRRLADHSSSNGQTLF